jgi:hypothetical protein
MFARQCIAKDRPTHPLGGIHQSDVWNLAALAVLGAEELQGAAVETVMASVLVGIR